MKKFLLFIIFLCFSIQSYALSIKDTIKNNCSGFINADYFYTGFDCSGDEKNIYYINNEKVTKEKYDIEKSNYDKKGPICDETKNSKLDDFPKDISFKCIKGNYGEYYYKGKTMNYSEWKNLIIRLSIQSYANNESDIKIQNEIKISETKLQTYESFVKSIIDGTWNGINTYYAKGSDCNF